MKIKIDFENNVLPSKYTKHAEDTYKYKNIPVVSFPFEIEDVPDGTKCFCVALVDHDAIPVCGFSWIHWSVANIPVNQTKIPEDYSRDNAFDKIQGKNSLSSLIAKETDVDIIQKYAGPRPPDRDHKYTLTVYAMKEFTNLKDGFYLNELIDIIDEMAIGVAKVDVIGKV